MLLSDMPLSEAWPAGGRRRKLLKAFYSERKQQFDISKVPDIYDSRQVRRHPQLGAGAHAQAAVPGAQTLRLLIPAVSGLQPKRRGLQSLLRHAGWKS